MSDGGTTSAAENTKAARAGNSSWLSRYNTIRNQILATIASLESAFKGKNEKVAIIGKSHENGVSFKTFWWAGLASTRNANRLNIIVIIVI